MPQAVGVPTPIGRRVLGLITATAAAAAVAPLPAFASPVGAAQDEEELVALCERHIEVLKTYNLKGGQVSGGFDPFAEPYFSSLRAVGAAQPRTLAGILAKARAAKAEAARPGGEEELSGSTAESWAWNILNAVLELFGDASVPRYASLSSPLVESCAAFCDLEEQAASILCAETTGAPDEDEMRDLAVELLREQQDRLMAGICLQRARSLREHTWRARAVAAAAPEYVAEHDKPYVEKRLIAALLRDLTA